MNAQPIAAPTLFVSEGKRAALLVKPTRAGHRANRKQFKTGHDALTWCALHGFNMVYAARAQPPYQN